MKPPESQSCQHYPECAGCDRLHIGYEKQLQHKQEEIEKRFGGFKGLEIRKIVKSPKEQMYRHKVQLPFGHRKIGKKPFLLSDFITRKILSSSIKRNVEFKTPT